MNIDTGQFTESVPLGAASPAARPATAASVGLVPMPRPFENAQASAVPRSLYRRYGKRLFDIMAVLFAVPIWVPVIVLLAAIVRIGGRHPFYSQPRIGKDGVVFRMWKLRSMVNGADALLAQYLAANPAARVEWDEKQKLSNDPRITRFGRFIRKTSLDELPQLWNVLKGEMSLVGPRPMMVDQQALYPGVAYFSMRPGLTGPWQVRARNDTSFASRATFDDGYCAEMGLRTDLWLLLLTTKVVAQGKGV
jgi:lipopolysaccharide/colanic/teichoic acid biosynthesis glycosyltransferase